MHVTNYRNTLIALLSFFVLSSDLSAAPIINGDNENCMLCHQLPFLANQETDGLLQSFVINPGNYSHSIHRNISCRDCHPSIDAFPHNEEIQPVDCSKSCHINRPFEMTIFSHKNQVKEHERSIHGYNPKLSEIENGEKPSCKYCHSNKAFDELDVFTPDETSHCNSCHDGVGLNDVVNHVDFHLSHRSAESSQDIVDLCSSCHTDESKMIQFGINTTQVEGFEHHFHGKAMVRGLDDVANCADCHSSHFVLEKNDPNSTLNENHIIETCSSNSQCHVNPTLEFAKSAVHSEPTSTNNPILFFTEWGFILLTAGVMALLFTHILMDIGRYLYDRSKRSQS